MLAKRDRVRRKHLMEGSFAQGANNHHLKRSRWRRLWRQRIQDWLIASVQNTKILLSHSGRGRREALGKALLTQFSPLIRLLARLRLVDRLGQTFQAFKAPLARSSRKMSRHPVTSSFVPV